MINYYTVIKPNLNQRTEKPARRRCNHKCSLFALKALMHFFDARLLANPLQQKLVHYIASPFTTQKLLV